MLEKFRIVLYFNVDIGWQYVLFDMLYKYFVTNTYLFI